MASDVEIDALLKEYGPIVRQTARSQWLKAGSPPGIVPEDLRNAGFRGVLEAAEDWEKKRRRTVLSLDAFVQIRVADRIKNELRDLQVGVRTTEKVERPDGSVGRFTFAKSADALMIDDPFGYEENNLHDPLPRVVGKLQKRIQRLGAQGDFQYRSAARMDYQRAKGSIPDNKDASLIWLLEVIQLPLNQDPEMRAKVEGLFARYKTATRVVLYIVSCIMPWDEGKARLKRAAGWIESYCSGRPLEAYPELPERLEMVSEEGAA
jgi:hypothetical protein